MALLGGIVLTLVILMVCASILGRGVVTFGNWDAFEGFAPSISDALLGTRIGPVPGDFELVEAGIAFAIFAFLPLCQLRGGHATVDVFTSFLPDRANDWLKAFWEVVLTLAILLITWRLGAGMLDKIETGEITFILAFPKWWAYAASLFAACAASLVAVYCAVARVAEAATGRPVITGAEESAP
ncbi:MAG: TRAP transporter small permease [Pseudomonadota bacterium]